MKTKITKYIKEDYIIKKDRFSVDMTISNIEGEIPIISITRRSGGDFKFENALTTNTLDKWETVAKLILEAIKVARKELV